MSCVLDVGELLAFYFPFPNFLQVQNNKPQNLNKNVKSDRQVYERIKSEKNKKERKELKERQEFC